MIHCGERRHVSDEHDRREGVSKALHADRQREGPKRSAAMPAMRCEECEREMGGRAGDRADEEARHHANAWDQPPGVNRRSNLTPYRRPILTPLSGGF